MSYLFKSSIGRKELVAATGLLFVLFLVVHLAGNFSIYGGSGAFDGYAEKLHALPPLVYGTRVGLVVIGLLHVALAFTLVLENLAARPQRYRVKRSEGGSTLASRTMLITGPLILIFIVLHVIDFVLRPAETTVSQVVGARFGQPGWVAFYVACTAVVGLHISHALWSGLQTLGFESARGGNLRTVSALVSLVFAVGFGLLPIIVYLNPSLLG